MNALVEFYENICPRFLHPTFLLSEYEEGRCGNPGHGRIDRVDVRAFGDFVDKTFAAEVDRKSLWDKVNDILVTSQDVPADLKSERRFTPFLASCCFYPTNRLKDVVFRKKDYNQSDLSVSREDFDHMAEFYVHCQRVLKVRSIPWWVMLALRVGNAFEAFLEPPVRV